MTEMTAFERRVADGMLHRAGPIRPVDDLAIYESVTAANRQQGWGFTMSSTLKFVAAAVIVALFGGFLLASVLTTQQEGEVAPAAVTESPEPAVTPAPTEPLQSVRTDILPGVDLTVEEVEPGVYRVVSDGGRDFASANNTDIVAGHDGRIWLLRLRRFVDLGGDEVHEWAASKPEVSGFEVAPDGTIWTVQDMNIQSFDGEAWALEKAAMGTIIDMAPSGTVWASWEGEDPDPPKVLAYLDEDGWQTLGHLGRLHSLLVAGPDDIWARAGWVFAPSGLYRFADGAWQRLVGIEGTEATWRTWQQDEDPASSDAELFGSGVGLGSDGTFWGVNGEARLLRFDGDEWRDWPLPNPKRHPVSVSVAPDGSAWLGTWLNARGNPVCKDGVGHFDGVAWEYYLRDLCVRSMDNAADGSVWVLGDDGDLFVITPAAVAVAE